MNLAPSLPIDLPRLVETRLLLTASSGQGKSWALRRLIEQTHGHIQQIVIDREGEFPSLRERFDFILAGKGGDCAADPRSAPLLARKLLELGTSAVLDIYDLDHVQRKVFVRRFLEALIESPRELWHPVLVVVDEAHEFAPESGKSEALSAVAALMSRGRKRGFCGVLATQRLSKLSKDVAAEALNMLVGGMMLDVDVKRAAELLGFSGREQAGQLRKLGQGEFFGVGPALTRTVTRAKIGPVATSHPQAGKGSVAVPAPRDAVRKVLAELGDLPAQAEAEIRDLETARTRIRALEREIKSATPVIDPERLAAERALGAQEANKKIVAVIASVEAVRDRAATAIDQALGQLKRAADALREPIDVPEFGAVSVVSGSQALGHRPKLHRERPSPTSERASAGHGSGSVSIGKGERLCLTAIAQHEDGVTRDQLSILAGYKRSTRDAYVQRLRTAGLIEDGGHLITATPDGVAALGPDFEPLPTGAALAEYWLGRLPEGERKCFEVVLESNGDPVEREYIGEATGYKRSTRDAYLQRLGSRKLITFDRGAVRPVAGLLE